MMKDFIPMEILPYMEEIAERLYAGHASVMVGAGFSKNAIKGESMKKHSPSWHELGDCFYRKIHGKAPADADKCYLDVLKLAEEVEAAYGRSTLDKLLKSEIPDKELQPSELHNKLLSLPWTDVFTTNYDTLLERAASTVLGQRYETIVNKKDLVWSTKPRIIKLHGSFPSDRPFIITEEDYRKYPKEFAPFVNTVQQSLLENTLCLLGFSGDDPNFVQWIGWIRDNLGKENSPKIFLIGLLDLSVGQRRLLDEKNIVPVDLTCWCDNGDKNHFNALMAFVNFLVKKKASKDKLNWAKRDFSDRLDFKKDITPQIKKVISKWENARLNYPNWLILPRDQRTTLKNVSEVHYSCMYHLDKVDSPHDIKFLYELNWRMEKYLMPIFNDWAEVYENVLKKYNPFTNDGDTDNDVITPISKEGHKITDWGRLKECWLELKLSLLRFYREEGFNDKWQSLSSDLEDVYDQMSTLLVARYHYERCLFHLFQLDTSSLRKELEIWKGDISIPYWEAKRAMILAELGDLNDAERILEASLREIRSQLYFYPTITDYLLVSQEGYVLQLLKYVKQSLNNRRFDIVDRFEDYNDRWNQLRQYGCDPWGELQLFEAYMLKGESSSYKSEERNYSFDIGQSTTTRRAGYNKVAQEAYGFLRYIEEIGIALKLPGVTFGKDAAEKAIAALSGYSSVWAYITLIRTGEKKIVNSVFNRKSMSFMTREYIESLAQNYLVILDKSTSNHNISRGGEDIFAVSTTILIPEILARLCFKCSLDVRLKILETIKKIAKYERVSTYDNALEALKQSLVKSFSREEQWNLLPQFLEFPIVPDRYDKNPDLFDYLRIGDTKSYGAIKLHANIISNLLAYALDFEGKRRIAITRLMKLYTYGLLNKAQTKLFAKNLWIRVDDKGFPVETNYYYVTWLSYPCPADVYPEKLLRSYINTEPLVIQAKNEGGGTPFYKGDIPILNNIVYTGKGIAAYDWHKDEINLLIAQMKEWWEGDKKYLEEKDVHIFGSLADEFKIRFRYLVEIFSYVVGPNATLIDKANIPVIESIVEDFHNFTYPDLQAKVSVLPLFLNKEKETIDKIIEQLCSRKNEFVLDAINASIMLNKNGGDGITTVLSTIVGNIKCRIDVDLDRHIDACGVILQDNPSAFGDGLLKNLEIGLTALVVENVIDYNDSEEAAHNKLLVRQSISRLIPRLKSHYISQKKKEHLFIAEWEHKLSDTNEFVDISNGFLERY